MVFFDEKRFFDNPDYQRVRMRGSKSNILCELRSIEQQSVLVK